MTTSPHRTSGVVAASTLARIVDLARQAPSIHNTQPWQWVARDGGLDLWRDLSRQLPATDPDGRQQVISCGTGLHHAVVAAHAFGLRSEVQHLPDPARPSLLARMTLAPGGTRSDVDLMGAISQRCTDRRRFTSWPLPAARVARLTRAAGAAGAYVVPVLDPVSRFRVERLVEGARRAQLRDTAAREETARWIDRETGDGLPTAVLPAFAGDPGEYPHRFVPDAESFDALSLRSSDGLVAVATERDDPSAWLSAGTALSDLWLRATIEGLSVVPLAQAIEDDTARSTLRGELGSRQPQALVRLGWQLISRRSLPRTPRRPLEEVFHVD